MRRVLPTAGDCCEYREKLHREKAEKKAAQRRRKQRNVTDACGNRVRSAHDSTAEIKQKSTSCRRLKKKRKKINESEKLSLDADQILRRIKPSYSDRAKYINVKHILCVLEAEEVLKIVKLKEIREKMNSSRNNDANSYEKTIKKGVVHTNKMKSGKTSRKDDVTQQDKHTNRCKNEVKLLKDECTSICSLDSEIDLADFALTKKEIEQIEKTRKQQNEQQNEERNNTSDEFETSGNGD